MNRRRLLALGTAAALGLAGCTGQEDGTDPGADADPTDGGGDGGDGSDGGDGEPIDADDGEVVRGPRGEVELPVEEAAIDDVVPKDRIPAITDPAFAEDWSDMDATLGDGERVIGVVRNGEARAYPLAILNYHEIVNEEFDGPLLVTYCPLCGSGVTAERRVAGEETTFGVSGKLWRSDLVMYDALTNSLWSQILGTAIRGERTGDRLTLVPSTITTWGQWRSDHPGTRVLLPPPESGVIRDNAVPQNYDRNPYARYESSDRIGVTLGDDFDDDRLEPKTWVIGVATDDAATAYPFDRVSDAGVVNDTVGDLPVVVTATGQDSLSAFDRRVDGRTLEFETAGEGRMRAGGSTWTRTTGIAQDGPFEGTRLDDAARVSTEFYFAWLNFHPDTAVYGAE